MLTSKMHFSGMKWGYSVWEREAPHIGRSLIAEQNPFKIKAYNLAKHYADFLTPVELDVWTLDGWLITSITAHSSYVTCHVRKGKKVATLTTPSESVFLHSSPSLWNDGRTDD